MLSISNSNIDKNERLRKSVIKWMDKEERPQNWIARKTNIFTAKMTKWLNRELELNRYELDCVEEYINK